MKRILLPIAALTALFSAATARADDASHAAAQKLVNMVSPKETLQATMKAGLQNTIKAMRQHGVPEDKIAKVSDLFDNFTKEVVNDPDLMDGMVKLYEDAFTADELNKLIDFYQTPLGSKALQKMPDLAEKGMEIGQQVASKYQGEIQEKMKEIMTAPEAAPAAPTGSAPASEATPTAPAAPAASAK